MKYYFVAGCLVDDGVVHFATEGNTWEEAYCKAIYASTESTVMDSGDVDFDMEYYKSKAIFNSFAIVDFPMMDKREFLENNPEVTEEEYFATQLVMRKYLMEGGEVKCTVSMK